MGEIINKNDLTKINELKQSGKKSCYAMGFLI